MQAQTREDKREHVDRRPEDSPRRLHAADREVQDFLDVPPVPPGGPQDLLRRRPWLPGRLPGALRPDQVRDDGRERPAPAGRHGPDQPARRPASTSSTAPLSADDEKIAASWVRRFFEKVRTEDEKLLLAILRFYFHSRQVSPEALDKMDFLLTLVGARRSLDDGRYLPRFPQELTKLFGALLAPRPPLAAPRRRS